MRLAGKRILIVGGGQRVFDAATDPMGNGRAMAMICARERAIVAVADRVPEAADATASAITDAGGCAFPIIADIGDADQVTAMVAEAVAGLGGPIDGLVLNVGIGTGALGLEAATPEGWDTVFRINARGPMLCCRAAMPQLADGASILFISSIASLVAGSRLPAYDASKAALGGLMRHVAMEGAPRRIRANIICPGLIDTPLGRVASQGRPSRASARIPLGRSGTAQDVANCALFLLSDESSYVDAQIIAVDGGLTGIS